MNAHIVDTPHEGVRDLIDAFVEQMIPGAIVLAHVIVSPDEGCGIRLENPEGQRPDDRLTIPARELEGRIVRLPKRLNGELWLVVSFAHVGSQIVRGRLLTQWKKHWEDHGDFDVFTTDRRDYFA